MLILKVKYFHTKIILFFFSFNAIIALKFFEKGGFILKTIDSKKINLEKLLQDGNIIRIKPQGYSMYPLFIPGRDEALIQKVPVQSLRRNDVVLYRRKHGILVLHRICQITSEGFFMTGDNQYEIEGPLQPEQIKGKLIAFIHNGIEISADNLIYRFFSCLWLLMLPIRPFCFKLTAFFRKLK